MEGIIIDGIFYEADTNIVIQKGDSIILMIPNTEKVIPKNYLHTLTTKIITEVVIPETVTVIEKRAFEQWENLRKVTFTGNPKLTTIGENAFSKCSKIEEFIVPDSVTEIREYAFFDCYNLKKVKIGKSVQKIGETAFKLCPSLVSVEFATDGKLISIGDNAFSHCTDLHDIKFPPGLEHIGCDVLQDTLYEKNKLNWTDDMLYNGNYLLKVKNKKLLTEITVKEGTELIAAYTFHECINLEIVNLPTSLKYICEVAFGDCCKLKKITAMYNIRSIGNSAFEDCLQLRKLKIGKYCNYIGFDAFSYCERLEYIFYDYDENLPTGNFKKAFSITPIKNLFLNVSENTDIFSMKSDFVKEIKKSCPKTLTGIFLTNSNFFPDNFDVKDLIPV